MRSLGRTSNATANASKGAKSKALARNQHDIPMSTPTAAKVLSRGLRNARLNKRIAKSNGNTASVSGNSNTEFQTNWGARPTSMPLMIEVANEKNCRAIRETTTAAIALQVI